MNNISSKIPSTNLYREKQPVGKGGSFLRYWFATIMLSQCEIATF